MNSLEVLEKLYDGFQDGMAGRSFYDIIKQDLERLEQYKKDLKYLNEQEIEQWHFPNGRIILGIDITNMPSNEEVKKRILKETIKRLIGNE